MNLNPPVPGKKGKRDVIETKLENDGDLDVPSLSEMNHIINDNSNVQSVPYTMVIDGHNVTITSVEEYFVHSDVPDPTEDYDLEL